MTIMCRGRKTARKVSKGFFYLTYAVRYTQYVGTFYSDPSELHHPKRKCKKLLGLFFLRLMPTFSFAGVFVLQSTFFRKGLLLRFCVVGFGRAFALTAGAFRPDGLQFLSGSPNRTFADAGL